MKLGFLECEPVAGFVFRPCIHDSLAAPCGCVVRMPSAVATADVPSLASSAEALRSLRRRVEYLAGQHPQDFLREFNESDGVALLQERVEGVSARSRSIFSEEGVFRVYQKRVEKLRRESHPNKTADETLLSVSNQMETH